MSDTDYLHRQLVKLGDMMGDGLHHEPDGKWISQEYRRILKALGMMPKRKNNSEAINLAVIEALKSKPCPKCNGDMKQTRSGSLSIKCVSCESRFKFKRGRNKNVQ